MKLFSEEELEELRKADAELEEDFHLTYDEVKQSRSLDRETEYFRLDNKKRKQVRQKKSYYAANKERILAYGKKYREEHKETHMQMCREYKKAHRDRIMEEQKAYRESHREELAAAARDYYRQNREKVIAAQRAYREANKERINAQRREQRRTRKNEQKVCGTAQ